MLSNELIWVILLIRASYKMAVIHKVTGYKFQFVVQFNLQFK